MQKISAEEYLREIKKQTIETMSTKIKEMMGHILSPEENEKTLREIIAEIEETTTIGQFVSLLTFRMPELSSQELAVILLRPIIREEDFPLK